MTRLAVSIALAGAIVATAPAAAQSLGDLARQEESRRAVEKTPSRLFTNANLVVEPQRVAPAAADVQADTGGGYMSVSAGVPLSAEEIIARSQKKVAASRKHMDEHYWRREAGALRAELEKAQRNVDTLSTPAERSPALQAFTDQALQGARKVLAGVQKRWQRFEDAAHYGNVPKHWLEP